MTTKGWQDFYVLVVVGVFFSMVTVIQVSDAASLSNLENRLVDLENQGRKQALLLSQQDKEIQQVRHELKLSKKTIQNHESLISAQNTQLAEQQKYIEETKKELTWYKTQIKKQNSRIQDLEDALKQQAILDEEDSAMVDEARNQDNLDEEKSDMIKVTGNQGNQSSNIHQRKYALPGARINRKQKRFVMDEAGGPVAFYATTDKGNVQHIGINQRIVLDQVIINHGNGYHNQHGVFIAPIAGVYTFSTSVLTTNLPDHREIEVTIVKNGTALGRAFGYADGGRFDQGAVTVITELQQGDEVWVSNHAIADAAYFGVRYTTFSGHLIN